MSYVARTYPDIVRDLLTTLTGGTVRETLDVPDTPGAALPELQKLNQRPVRRISHLQGVIEAKNGDEIPYRFTNADYELVAAEGDGNLNTLRFRENGRIPKPGSQLVVNYYPVETVPVPLSDLNVGSVVRTMMETWAREMALAYMHLEDIYNSAYIDTAESRHLDNVVALVGVRRLKPGHPLAKLRFSRRSGLSGKITVQANTAVTDANGARYLTRSVLTLEPTEISREVLAIGESPATPLAEAGTLTRPETLIAGIAEVTNPAPAYDLTSEESDADLRLRARNALIVNSRGTLDAMRFGLLAVPGVKDVSISEHPNGVAGEIKIDVAYTGEGDLEEADILREVQKRVEELRPAGVRVLGIGTAARRTVRVKLELTLSGAGVAENELAALLNDAEARLDAYLDGIAPGATVRRSKMLAKVLEDDRIADARILLVPSGEDPVEELTLDTGQVLDVEGYDIPTPTTEEGAATAVTATLEAFLPIHLQNDYTAAEAESDVSTALASYLGTVNAERPLTVDAALAAMRDESRYICIRAEVVLTVITPAGNFAELRDASGSYAPAANESLQLGTLNVEAREG